MKKAQAASERKPDAKRNNSPFREMWRRLRKNRLAMSAMGIVLALVLIVIFADLIAPYQLVLEQGGGMKLAPPSGEHLFGCDQLGRDLFARCVHGARISLMIGFATTGIVMAIAVIFGTLAAFAGGRTDNIVMRFFDIMISIPAIVYALAIAAGLGSGIPQLMVAICLGSIPSSARVVRAAALNVVDQDYIEAARVIGLKSYRIVLAHVLPNILGTILVQATMAVAANILMGALFSFLGLGAPVPTPEWGKMISDALPYLRQSPHAVLFPMAFLALTALSINLLGDGLRDAFDPRLKGKA